MRARGRRKLPSPARAGRDRSLASNGAFRLPADRAGGGANRGALEAGEQRPEAVGAQGVTFEAALAGEGDQVVVIDELPLIAVDPTDQAAVIKVDVAER